MAFVTRSIYFKEGHLIDEVISLDFLTQVAILNSILVPFRMYLMEEFMPTLTIKNVPTKLLEHLKKSASEHHRSLSGEVLFRLEQGLSGYRVDPEAFLVGTEALQKQINHPPLTEKILKSAKEEGRP